ncbi:NACHT LRR and PYD domains-containing protein 5 [Dissostichus eleginoides]|uniref:NACHT LRR and PYD domains-containing protein 5 n=1 Tax=Dissostichus eleginoides TaxID=100907 RepID=A0AAD9BDD8_DISEL|nr:NACHT LRR and PYD domains-containing protein 5 [Dissostichus eleginoides]
MEQMSVAHETDDGPQELLHSNKEVVYHFQPNCTAQSGGNVVAPSITGSTITNLNFIITSTGQGSIVSSKEASNHDTADISDDLKPQKDKITECQEELKAKLKRKFGYLLQGMNACNLTAACCKILEIGIHSSDIRELDLGNNNITDDGILVLSDTLKNSKLEKLRLAWCSVTEEGCTFLASALNFSRLKELDLSYNHPGPLGLQLLSALKEDPRCSLHELSVEQCGESRILPGPMKWRLTFFRISCGAMTLIHNFYTTFTEPVYPGFWLGWVDSTVYL